MRTRLCQDRTSSTFDWFDPSFKLHVFLNCVKMLYYSDNGETCKSVNITKIPIFLPKYGSYKLHERKSAIFFKVHLKRLNRLPER